MTTPLPPNPSLENLKKQAKALKKAWQDGEAAALGRLRAAHPRFEDGMTARLADAQLALARELGFSSWRVLSAAVALANQEKAERFVSSACLCYDDPHFDHRSFHEQAMAMLSEDPSLAKTTIWAAAAAGDAAAVRGFLKKEPSLVNRPGPHGWAPLLCACYSRVAPTLDVTKLLLDAGADPNAFTLKGNMDERLDQTKRKFTALTGLFGGGSTGMANQPAHPQGKELAELLLERGADPADAVAIGISQGDGTYGKLEILLRHGLKPDVQSDGVTLMGRALRMAVVNGDEPSVGLLLEYKARTDEVIGGKTLWQLAMGRGHREIARRLEEAGAPVASLAEMDQFIAACLAGDEAGARAMLERSGDLVERAPKNMVNQAANGKRVEAVRLVLDLGFDPSFMDEVTALHNAAGKGNFEIVRLLLERGGSLTLREPFYDGTAVGWADFLDQRTMRDFLLDEGPICLFDALEYGRLDRMKDILRRDPEALNRPFAKYLTREPREGDWETPLARMRRLGNTEAVEALLARGATD